MKLSVPASSSSPHRPQVLTRSAALLKSSKVSISLLAPYRYLRVGAQGLGLGALLGIPIRHRGDECDLEDPLGDQPSPVLADEAVAVAAADVGGAVLEIGAEAVE